MTNQEILEKAIQKAIDNGWKSLIQGDFIEVSDNKFTGEPHLAHKADWNNNKWALGESVASVLLDKEFAKALWGNEDLVNINLEDDDRFNRIIPHNPNITGGHADGQYFNGYVWQFHLQQMVIAPDPIKYLGEHLD